MTGTSENKLSIGIVGCGLVGSSLALCLQRNPDIDIQVYEMRENLTQRSGSIGLVQAIDTFEFLGVKDEVEKISAQFKHAKTFTETKILMSSAIAAWRVERCKLLNVLVSKIRPEILSLSKKVMEVIENENGAVILFADGTKSKAFDLVIGADGCHSRVARSENIFKFVSPHPTGHTILQVHGSSHLIDEPFRNGWNRLLTKRGTTMTCIGFECRDGSIISTAYLGYRDVNNISNGWEETTSRTEILNILNNEISKLQENESNNNNNNNASININSFLKSMKAIVSDADTVISKWGVWESPDRETWISFKSRVTLVGDSAHPMSPDFGQGCNQGLEDVKILGPLLCKIAESLSDNNNNKDKDKHKMIANAFKEYENTRKPFVEYVKNTSRGKSNIEKTSGSGSILIRNLFFKPYVVCTFTAMIFQQKMPFFAPIFKTISTLFEIIMLSADSIQQTYNKWFYNNTDKKKE